MTHTILHRSGMTALAAVLALSSTPLFAQDATVAQPVVATPTTTTPVVDPIAPIETITTTTTTTETATDPLAPDAAAATAAPATRTTTSRTSTRRTATVARPVRAATAPAASASATPLATAEPVAPLTATPVAPVVAETAPVPAPPAQDTSLAVSDDLLPIAGAAGLGLLALVGAGAALRRRKRRAADDDVTAEWTEPTFAAAPPRAEPAPALAPRQPAPDSAFGWAAAPAAAAAATANPLPAGIDRATLGRHVEAAYRGPTADNPSLSLKTRIKRAAFFDQRERLVAKGKAAPVAPGAGLPSAMAKQASRVREAAKPRAPRQVSFQRSYQPAGT